METIPTPDGTLLRRYRAGDEAAFAELRGRYERLVFSTCRRETADVSLAEDATQAVFLLMTQKSFSEEATLAGWLFGAARLVSKNLLRQERRRIQRERQAFAPPEEPDGTWDLIEPHLNEAIASLKSADREAIVLRFGAEASMAEVGRALGVEENSARMRVSRAVDRLRDRLTKTGVVVTSALLATLLSTRMADAAPPLAAMLSPRSARALQHAAWALPLVTLWKPVALVVLTGIGGGFVAMRAISVSRAKAVEEVASLFRSSQGSWIGTLEFADDATGRRTKTQVNVVIDRPEGGLRIVARYPSFANIDTTTLTPLPDGRFRIENGGTGSSHRLDGEYEYRRSKDGTPFFVGFSLAVRAEVRLRLSLTDNRLFLQEDVLREEGYRLRNRFELTR